VSIIPIPPPLLIRKVEKRIMKQPSGFFGTRSPSSTTASSGLFAMLWILLWCTSLTIATSIGAPSNGGAAAIMKPTRTINQKRTVDSEPILIEEDQCASFRSDIGSDLKRLLNLSWMESGEEIDVCLCSSTVSNFVQSTKNKQVEIAKAFVGPKKVTEALQTLISRRSPQICPALPAHANRTCNTDGRKDDTCDFSCQSPYRKSGQKCVLPASPSARPRKRSLEEQVTMMHTSSCRPNEQVCARNGHASSPSRSTSYRSPSMGNDVQFECIDVSKDLVNCGGCAAGSLGFDDEVVGVDCSDLVGVSDVQCVVGRCKVGKCRRGWKINVRGDGCVRNRG